MMIVDSNGFVVGVINEDTENVVETCAETAKAVAEAK